MSHPMIQTSENQSLLYADVLNALDPDSKGFIDIEELKHLILKLSKELQDPVREILQTYVFEHRTFRITCEKFLILLQHFLEKSEIFIDTPSPIRTINDSFLRSSTFSNWSSKKSATLGSPNRSRLKSCSPKKNPSYKDIYQRKKSVENETWKKNERLAEKIDFKNQTFTPSSEKSQSLSLKNESFVIGKQQNTNFKSKYANCNELLRIRQKHLALSNKYNK